MKLQEFVARSSEVVNELSKAIENEQMGLKEVEESGQREGLESADGKNQRLPGVSLPIISAAIYLLLPQEGCLMSTVVTNVSSSSRVKGGLPV